MLCPYCSGTGNAGATLNIPCPVCLGSKFLSCCEGTPGQEVPDEKNFTNLLDTARVMEQDRRRTGIEEHGMVVSDVIRDLQTYGLSEAQASRLVIDLLNHGVQMAHYRSSERAFPPGNTQPPKERTDG